MYYYEVIKRASGKAEQIFYQNTLQKKVEDNILSWKIL